MIVERPIIFNDQMAQETADGSKTQTRRIVKYKPKDLETLIERVPDKAACCPYGKPGHRLWVREAFFDAKMLNEGRILYRSAGDKCRFGWTPSIHMPRAASRITLEITGVRVERLQVISEADALAEGVRAGQWEYDNGEGTESALESYECLWEYINSKSRPKLPKNPHSKRYARVKNWLETHPDTTSWSANPLVWVIEFKVVKGGAA